MQNASAKVRKIPQIIYPFFLFLFCYARFFFFLTVFACIVRKKISILHLKEEYGFPLAIVMKKINFSRLYALVHRLSDRYLHFVGLPAVYLGVLLMAVSFIVGWSSHNWIMGLSLIFIIVGIIGYVLGEKQKSNY